MGAVTLVPPSSPPDTHTPASPLMQPDGRQGAPFSFISDVFLEYIYQGYLHKTPACTVHCQESPI